MEGASQERGIHGVDLVIDFLERHRAAYEVVEHRDTFAATSEARAAGTLPERMAKTVPLHDHDGFRVAVIPATEQLDLHKARALLEASGHLRLASEEEIERKFPAFDVGVLPPFSSCAGDLAPRDRTARQAACGRPLRRLGPALAAQPLVTCDHDVNAVE